MSNDPLNLHFQAIRQHIARLQQQDATAWTEIEAVLEDLHVIYENMQTDLETVMLVEQQLLQQNQHYHDLFQTAPIAYLTTDADGLILEANQASAQLLNVPQLFLTGKPLILYVAEGDRSNFRTRLNQLAQNSDQQIWQLHLRPREGEAMKVHLQVAVSRTPEGRIERVKIGIFNLSQPEQVISSAPGVASPGELREALGDALVTQQNSNSTQAKEISVSPLPYSLDGL